MNIAFFNSSLPEPDRKVGGADVFVHRLANRLVRRGHEVTVLTFGSSPADAAYRVTRAGPAWLTKSHASRLILAPLALNWLPQSPFDVLHLHGDDWFFCRRSLPTVRTFYGSALLESRSATSMRRRHLQLAIYPLEVIASRLATESYDIGTPLPHGYRIAGSLPLAVDLPATASKSGRSERPTVLFVGTWAGRKRGALLAEVFEEVVLRRHPEAELVMVSDRCEERAGVRWVRFPSDAELAELYRRAWVFCMPSTYEGFGMPYLEAMEHGLPVVASSNPGSRFLLGGGEGLIVEDADLGTALSDLLGDADARDRLATAGRARAQDFQWNRVADLHESAYRQAIAAFTHRRARG